MEIAAMGKVVVSARVENLQDLYDAERVIFPKQSSRVDFRSAGRYLRDISIASAKTGAAVGIAPASLSNRPHPVRNHFFRYLRGRTSDGTRPRLPERSGGNRR